ncbi:peptide MFS transporter [Sphingomonas sp. ASV193]|uniref:peptide MFS transporter n=1 Tax=Sphingomonas sp. ASV193 TaxID=3144405 RepID=UPI0032E91728
MSVAEATPDFERGDPNDRAFLGHPKGLGYLSFVEGCERFSYYSMQTLLTLYMVNYLLLPGHVEGVVGLGWLRGWHYPGLGGQPLSSAIFGDYTSLVYLTPILGGIVADRFIGRRAALIAGGAIMALGHFLMAFEHLFLLALVSLIVGVGLFKGNIASQVGALYKPSDLRRAMAFQIFYIAINVSVIIAPLISGTLGQKVGWHWGFGCAGVVMVAGLLLFLKGTPYLPDNAPASKGGAARERMGPGDWPRVLALVLLVPAMAIGLLTNQQIFNAYLVWADKSFDLRVGGLSIPSSWMITIDAALSFGMLVAVAAFWKWRASRTGREPDELGKMIIGSFFTIGGGLCLYMAAATAGPGGKVGLFWPLMFHFVNAIGFANILPVSLALFSKIAPRAINSTVIGIYYLAFFLANKIVGIVGEWFTTMPTTQFWLLHAASAAVGLVAFVLFKLLVSDRMVAGAAEPLPE